MASNSRDHHIRREKGQALVRALHVSELQAAGDARAAALREADRQIDRIARLLPDALASGIALAEVARITSVSRPTLYELRARHTDDERDLTFAVLQAVAGRGPINTRGVAERLRRPHAEMDALVETLLGRRLLGEDFNDDPENPMMELFLTNDGFEVLEGWDFDDAVDHDDPSAE